jgi:type II secretory pathway pseudopilin PulG
MKLERVRPRYDFFRLNKTLRNEAGAIDLASIMVGIIVIGLIGGVIASTIFAVIPWTQDKAAKEQLISLHSAQNAYYGLSSDPSSSLPAGAPRNSFFDSPGLASAGLMSESNTYCTVLTNGGKDYDAFVKSGSGKIFKSTNGNKTAVALSDTDTITGACSFLKPAPPVTPLSCGDGKYTPVGDVTLSCSLAGPWGGDRIHHIITVTPTSPVLGHWKVIVDLTGVTTLTQVRVSGPSGFSPTIDGVDMGNVDFLSSNFTVEGNTNNNLPASPQNHWDISTAKSPETILLVIDY